MKGQRVNAQTEHRLMDGPVGPIELALDRPAEPRAGGGTVVISHPHPLFGGTFNNKVVQTLARAVVQAGWVAVRYNFRGVGASAGAHDHGVGETEDLLAVIAAQAAGGPLGLAGFSFGGFVTCAAVDRLWQVRAPERVMLVGTATSRFQVPAVPAELHPRTLVVHGEQDDTVPLAAALDWARPQSLPVTVVPGVAHFFHGQLPLLKSLAVRHFAG